MASGVCPVCAASVPVASDVLLHELLTCPECGAELEVTNLSPLTFEQAPQVEEDWGE